MAGGAALLVCGGTTVAPESAPRQGTHRPEAVRPLRERSGTCEREILPLTTASGIGPEGVTVAHRTSGRIATVPADRVVVVGERRPRGAPDCTAPLVLTVGDAVVPRRVAHAIAEGWGGRRQNRHRCSTPYAARMRLTIALAKSN
ncbi:hypothetical protein [Streptomyces sp. NPDC021212]|uniref:hypothetical protein n=1 Tax=Streptomyces sp. NPDC021212 TaxID=3365118 RepID=UPI0037AC187E